VADDAMAGDRHPLTRGLPITPPTPPVPRTLRTDFDGGVPALRIPLLKHVLIHRTMPLLVPDDDATSWIRLRFLSSKYSKLAQDEHEPAARPKWRLDIPWEQWAVLGLAIVLFIVSVVLFKQTVTKSLQVDKFTEDGHLRPQAFWPYSMHAAPPPWG
jgi:hypothetical protein